MSESSKYRHPSKISLFNYYDSLPFPTVKGKKVFELIDSQSDFFEWALKSSAIFCFDDYTFNHLTTVGFRLSEGALESQKRKREQYQSDVLQSNKFFDTHHFNFSILETNIKLFKLEYKVGFGVFSQKTIEELITLSPSRIEFFINCLPWFGLTREAIDRLKQAESGFTFMDSTFRILEKKYDAAPSFMKSRPLKRRNTDDFYAEPRESEYAGSYAHDQEGLDDDFINDVLEGDPDNYWNID